LPLGSTLSGWTFFSQHGYWNYCAPANLAMALSYYGWEGELASIGTYVKPFDRDKNVMPYELAEYVNTQTYYRALVREGGTIELARRLLANGFPLLVEKGVYIKDYSGVVSWMGHYQVLVGYDDATQSFIALDSYFGEVDKPTLTITYADLEKEWRPFNYILLVVYAPEQEERLRTVLGAYADSVSSYQIAADLAAVELQTQTGQAQFFAAFNRGTSLMRLQDYAGAAQAYDDAFTRYAALPKEDRPWRMMWYQTGPYFAYYYTGRYQDVVSLADTTISSTDQPFLEENFLWRSRARHALGDWDGAALDVVTCLEYHPDFTPCVEQAGLLGVDTATSP
jgi:tetratricopeptide (TPR) repeat protein